MNGQVGIAAIVLGGTASLFLLHCETRRGASSAPAVSTSGSAEERTSVRSATGVAEGSTSGLAASGSSDAAGAGPTEVTSPIDAGARLSARGEMRTVRFAWQPPGAPSAAYEMSELEDQHRIVLPRGAAPIAALPVLVAFHGQPRRGEAPRRYSFGERVLETAARAMAAGDVQPLIVVLPVFRYFGTNWPEFEVSLFKKEIESRLASEGVKAKGYYIVGHSGAAGCGGDGMNRAHRMRPTAVGFFDTCLGRGWRDEVERLRSAHVPTLLVHSLETAAFSPKQATEYLSTFDFGRAYGPAGLAPIDCPTELPKAPLRAQPFRCSADEKGVTRGLIVDSGEGEEGHNALVPIALEYFLRVYIGARDAAP
ncbi:MAG: hypothetical protein ABW133_10465 [Polyangiaceae bacterium]